MQKKFEKYFRPGEKWSGTIGKGKYIHFKALGDNANVSILMYNMRDTSERYNMPDTLKGQFTAHLTKGNVLYSDNGRVFASIVQDSLGWHDSISGYTSRELTDEKYGKTNYQHQGNTITAAARRISKLSWFAITWTHGISYPVSTSSPKSMSRKMAVCITIQSTVKRELLLHFVQRWT